MNDVFLLGAGFSRAISEMPDGDERSLMPLMKELGEILREKIPDDALRAGDTFEHWMTYLANPQPWHSELQTLENRAMFLKLAKSIEEVVRCREIALIDTGSPPEALSQLIKKWSDRHATVVTTNYDTIVERALWPLGGQEPQEFYAGVMTPAFARRVGQTPGANNLRQFDL